MPSITQQASGRAESGTQFPVPKPVRPGFEFQVGEAGVGVLLHGVPGTPLREEMAS